VKRKPNPDDRRTGATVSVLLALAAAGSAPVCASNALSLADGSSPGLNIAAGRNARWDFDVGADHRPATLVLAVRGRPGYRVSLLLEPGGPGQVSAVLQTVATSGRYLEPGRYTIDARLRESANGYAGRLELSLTIERNGEADSVAAMRAAHLAWLEDNARVGVEPAVPRSVKPSSSVPEPFEPLRVSGRRIDFSGRSLSLGDNGLPSSLKIDGRELLSRPMVLRGLEVEDGWQFRVTGQRPASVTWSSEGHVAGTSISLSATLHYDGFLAVRLDIEPPHDGFQPGAWSLDVPLKRNAARYLGRLTPGTLPRAKNAPPLPDDRGFDGGAVPDGRRALPFSFLYTVSGDDAGILLAFESDEAWRVAGRRHAFAIDASLMEAVFSAGFADSRNRLAERFAWEFALQLLPVRRLPEREKFAAYNAMQWADAATPYRQGVFREGSLAGTQAFPDPATAPRLSAFDRAVADGLRTVIVHQGWTELQGYPGTFDARRLDVLRRFAADANRRGVRVLAYVGLELSMAAPEWHSLAPLSAAVPLRFGRTRSGIRSIRPDGGSEAYADFLVARLANLVALTGIDGVFLDLVAEPQVSMNPMAGRGYVDESGRPQGELPLAANRRLLERVYRLFHAGGKPGGIVACHAGGPPRPSHAFCDYVLAGEDEVHEKRQQPGARLPDILPLDRFRALYDPHVRGVPLVWLSKPARGGLSMDESATVALPHGVPQRVQWPHFVAADASESIMNPAADVYRHWRVWRTGWPAAIANASWSAYDGGVTALDDSGTLLVSRGTVGDTEWIVVSNPRQRPASGRLELANGALLSDLLGSCTLPVERSASMTLTLPAGCFVIARIDR